MTNPIEFDAAALQAFVNNAAAGLDANQQILLFALLGLATSQVTKARKGTDPNWNVKFTKKDNGIEVDAGPTDPDWGVWQQRFADAFTPGAQESGGIGMMRIIPRPGPKPGP